MSHDPFELLIDIERKCKANAKPLPHKQEGGQIWQGIGFVSSNLHFLAPLKEVKEVLTLPAMTALPASADWFMGVASLRGQVLPITDLQCFLQGEKQTITPMSRILVVDFEKTGVGFMVPQVLGVQRFLDKTLQTSIENGIDPNIKEHLQGEFINEVSKWYVLSLKNLSQTGQFYHVVQEAGA